MAKTMFSVTAEREKLKNCMSGTQVY